MLNISIILCVYNGEKWIKACLERLVNQTCENKEIIIIDDGSEDGTGEIIDLYVKEHSEMRLLRRENRGLCISRLDGMRLAKGKYVGFVDVDDDFDNDMFERMLIAAEKGNYDIVECHYDLIGDGYSKKVYRQKKEEEKRLHQYRERMKIDKYGADILLTFLEGWVHEPLWMRIYKKRIIKNVYNNLVRLIDVKRKLIHIGCEDEYLLPLLFMEANSYHMLEEVKYHHYYMEPTGITANHRVLEFKRKLLEASIITKDYFMDAYVGEKHMKNIKTSIYRYIGRRILLFHDVCSGKDYDMFCECFRLAGYNELFISILSAATEEGKKSRQSIKAALSVLCHLNKCYVKVIMAEKGRRTYYQPRVDYIR